MPRIRLRVASNEEAVELMSAGGSLAVEAVSPRVAFEKVSGGTRLDITDIDGTKSAILPDGAAGQDGVGIRRVWVNSASELVVELTDDTVYISDSIRGRAGKDGADGNDGADGVTFTPSVSNEGVISWSNDGGKTNPQPVNIRGPKGEPGSDATVTVDDALSMTSENPVQNKVIAAEAKDIRDAIVSAGFVPATQPGWELGYYYSQTGAKVGSSLRIRTQTPSISGLDYYVRSDPGVVFIVLFYNSVEYVPRTSYPWVTECSIAAIAPSGADRFRLVARTDPESDLTNVVEETAAKVKVYRGSKQDKLVFDAAPTSGSANPVTSGGVYTALQAKADPVTVETVSGTDPAITGVDNHCYVCGTVDTLTLTLPASGSFEVWFTSGTTATVLNANGVTMPDWWAGVEPNRTYDLIVTNGYGVVTSWSA